MKAEVRLANEADAPIAAEWLQGTPDNLLDRDIADYPSLRTLAVDIAGEPADYIPFHPVLAVESIGRRPGLSPKAQAYALRQAHDALERIAKVYSLAEIWWMCADDSLIKLAERHGYEVVQTKVLRKKVSPNV